MKSLVKQSSGVVLLVMLAVMSVADRSGVMWLAVRGICFAGCLVLGLRNPRPLLGAMAAGFASISVWGFSGLDLAIVCLGFALFRVKLRHLAVAMAVVGLVGSVSWLGFGWPFPFHNRNHYAVFCELGLPVLIYVGRKSRNRNLLVAAGLMVLTALVAGSRIGAVLLLGEACAIWAAVAGREKFWIAGPALAIAASLFLMVSGGARITKPLEGDHRVEIWQSGLQMVAAKPVTGWGAGEFPRVYPAYAQFDNGQIVNAAHSDWIEWSAEFGLVAGVLFLGMFAWWIRKSIHYYPSWGILVGALHAGVDYPFHMPGLLVFAAALAGSIEANGTSIQAKPTDRQRRNS